jgi:hypothetical protein
LKFPHLKPFLENRPAQVQAVLLICILAIVRIIIALILDLSRPVYSTAELITDSSIFILFLSLLIIAHRKLSFKRVHPIFGILIMLLLGFNFLQFGGIEGTNCFNFYSGIYVIVMLYSGRRLYTLISLQLILLVSLIFLVYINHPFYQSILISINRESSAEFIFSLVSIAVFTFYLKRVTVSEIAMLESKINEVRGKVKESKILNQELITQSKELKQAQKLLKEEVTHRAKAIENQNEAIEQYIHHNTETLRDPLLRLSTAVSEFKGETQLHMLLKLSHAELIQVVTSINQTLQSDAKLNRTTLTKNSE